MDKPTEVQTLTNVEVGRRIGLHHTSVSRVRKGERVPSLEVMQKVATMFEWSLDRQAAAKNAGTYSRDFEVVIKARYDAESALAPKPLPVPTG